MVEYVWEEGGADLILGYVDDVRIETQARSVGANHVWREIPHITGLLAITQSTERLGSST